MKSGVATLRGLCSSWELNGKNLKGAAIPLMPVCRSREETTYGRALSSGETENWEVGNTGQVKKKKKGHANKDPLP